MLMTIEPRQPNRLEKKKNTYRSPLSPWPDFTFVLAFLRRSAVSDFPTSSDSLNLPPAPRLTNRLSVPVSISSRFAAFFRVDLLRCRLLCHVGLQRKLCNSSAAAADRMLSIREVIMDMEETNPGANITKQPPDAPLGYRCGDKTWEPPQGEQGVLSREVHEQIHREQSRAGEVVGRKLIVRCGPGVTER